MDKTMQMLNEINCATNSLKKCATPSVISNALRDRQRNYLNEFELFTATFNLIPNIINEINIDCKKANLAFLNQFKTQIKDVHYSKIYFGANKKAELDDIFYFIYEDLLVNFDNNCHKVRFLFKHTSIVKVENIIAFIVKFKRKKVKFKPKINIISVGKFGLELNDLEILKPKSSILDNYNDDFIEVHQTIVKSLLQKNKKGLVMLHGKPGTGKTSYIRYLVATVKKDILFLPFNLASEIISPNFITLLTENPNSILVIEDAENVINSRENNPKSPVSALLNITDGLLSDCLNVQVICSFNTDISKIDSALLRKGRLIARYEFNALEPFKAQQLSNKLGFTTKIHHPITLTEIYNQKQQDYSQKSNLTKIGFKTA